MNNRTPLYLLVCLFALAYIGCDTAVQPAPDALDQETTLAEARHADKQDLTSLCHKRDGQGYIPITVADASFDAHVAHGDAGIGSPVPGMEGFVFDETCLPVPEVPCPCFTLGDLQSEGPIDRCVEDTEVERSFVYFENASSAASGNKVYASGLGCTRSSFLVNPPLSVTIAYMSIEQNASCRYLIQTVCSE